VVRTETLSCTLDELMEPFLQLAGAASPGDATPPTATESGGDGGSESETDFGLADFPLLPLGPSLWADASASVVHLDVLIPSLPDALVVLTGPKLRAAAVVVRQQLIDAVWVDDEDRMVGEAAAMALMGARDGSVSGYRLETPKLAEALTMLWRCRAVYREMPASWVNADSLLEDLEGRRRDSAIVVTGGMRGVALVAGGKLLGVYTEIDRQPVASPERLAELLRDPRARVTLRQSPEERQISHFPETAYHAFVADATEAPAPLVEALAAITSSSRHAPPAEPTEDQERATAEPLAELTGPEPFAEEPESVVQAPDLAAEEVLSAQEPDGAVAELAAKAALEEPELASEDDPELAAEAKLAAELEAAAEPGFAEEPDVAPEPEVAAEPEFASEPEFAAEPDFAGEEPDLAAEEPDLAAEEAELTAQPTEPEPVEAAAATSVPSQRMAPPRFVMPADLMVSAKVGTSDNQTAAAQLSNRSNPMVAADTASPIKRAGPSGPVGSSGRAAPAEMPKVAAETSAPNAERHAPASEPGPLSWPSTPVESPRAVPVDLGGASGQPAWPPIPLTNAHHEEGTRTAWGQTYSPMPAPSSAPSPAPNGPAQFPKFESSPALEALAAADASADFEGMKADLIQIGALWLGTDGVAPIAEMLRRTRPSIQDVMATIEAIKHVTLPGFETSVVQAMAREMHYHAAEYLSGL
jgi:hypothetical protein